MATYEITYRGMSFVFSGTYGRMLEYVTKMFQEHSPYNSDKFMHRPGKLFIVNYTGEVIGQVTESK